MEINYRAKYYYTDYTKKYFEEGTFYNSDKKPSLVAIKPTLNCVANCLHCNPRSKKFTRDRVLTIDEYNELFRKLKKLAEEQLNNEYNENVKKYLDEGINYPTALNKAIKTNINTPNDLLGLSYIKSILKNANCDLTNIDTDKLLDKEAIDVVKKLSEYTDIVVSATNKNEPSLISRYLIDLAQSVSRFYNEHQIICSDEDTKKARVALAKSVGFVIKSGLGLLGIQTPEKM